MNKTGIYKPMEDLKKYQQLVGVLDYLVFTIRPDIAYAVKWLAKKTCKASIQDFKKTKSVLNNLKHSSK